jgi:AraC-like DNA-binding protein
MVVDGSCWFQLNEEQPLPLAKGDFLLASRASAYSLLSDAWVKPVAVDPSRKTAAAVSTMRFGSSALDADVHLVGGSFLFDPANAGLLLSFLPSVIHVRSANVAAERLRSVVSLIGDEAQAERAGRELILSRLVEVLLIETLRLPQPDLGSRPQGLVGGLADPRLAKALRRLHGELRRDWTISELAAQAGMSRTVFARVFTEKVGMAPISYLLHWRMALAKDALRQGDRSLTDIADSIGYRSTSAFSTAFRRAIGVPPSEYAASARHSKNGLQSDGGPGAI